MSPKLLILSLALMMVGCSEFEHEHDYRKVVQMFDTKFWHEEYYGCIKCGDRTQEFRIIDSTETITIDNIILHDMRIMNIGGNKYEN